MSRDLWSRELRMAGADRTLLEVALGGGVPDDGLQQAGSAVLGTESSEVLIGIAGGLISRLRQRAWTGDAELVTELEQYCDDTPAALIPLPVDLDQLSETLDESDGDTSYIDLSNGVVWPGQLLESGDGPEDFDEDSDRWLPVEETGSRVAYKTMEQFVASIEQPDIASRLTEALVGRGAFGRFRNELSRYESEYTRWHRFRDDACLGRARACLAEHGYRTHRSRG